ncbi:hypothetical protein BJX65DRAFT_275672 [Aspergillus insuetus]
MILAPWAAKHGAYFQRPILMSSIFFGLLSWASRAALDLSWISSLTPNALAERVLKSHLSVYNRDGSFVMLSG